jgi:hypothetical protein
LAIPGVASSASAVAAEIKTLHAGASPADMLLSIARYHMDEAGREQARAKADEGREGGRPLDRELVRNELSYARMAARDAAMYCHRRLTGVAHTNPDGSPLDIAALAAILGKLPEGDIEQFERVLGALSVVANLADPTAAGDPAGKAPTSH